MISPSQSLSSRNCFQTLFSTLQPSLPFTHLDSDSGHLKYRGRDWHNSEISTPQPSTTLILMIPKFNKLFHSHQLWGQCFPLWQLPCLGVAKTQPVLQRDITSSSESQNLEPLESTLLLETKEVGPEWGRIEGSKHGWLITYIHESEMLKYSVLIAKVMPWAVISPRFETMGFTTLKLSPS